MDAFRFLLPTRVEFGVGSARRVAHEARALGAARVLVVTDRGVRAAGLVDPLVEHLERAGIAGVVFDEVAPNPREASVALGAALAAAERCDTLVAVGGGSPMDTAKAIGVLLTHGVAGECDILDFAESGRITEPITPLVVIPTTAGSGSETTFEAVITDAARAFKVSVASPFMAARVALVDPELTISLPRVLTAATGMDALAHAVEAATSLRRTPVSDSLALTAVGLISRSLRAAFANGADITARGDVMLASTLAGMAVANSSTGAAHCMAEAVAGLYDVPHGIANAMFLPVVMEYNRLGLPETFAALARALGEDLTGLSRTDAARAAVRAVEDLTADLRIPRAEQVGVRPDDLPRLAAVALDDPTCRENPRTLTEADLVALFHQAM